MNLLFLGDVVGRAGRDVVAKHLPDLRRRLDLDFVVLNGENAAAGFGITQKICNQFFELGVDVITTGNHVWDQKETAGFIDAEKRLQRPLNFPAGTPGIGAGVYAARDGRKVLVTGVMGRVFMDPLDDPFAALERELSKHRLGGTVAAAVVDLHGEATSEKMALGHFTDGRATLAVGSHSHVPTADTQILDGGTAYQTDAGMCGDYNSVIGMKKEEPMRRFTRKMSGGRFEASDGEGTLCGVFVVSDDTTGLATSVEPLRLGPRLRQAGPDIG